MSRVAQKRAPCGAEHQHPKHRARSAVGRHLTRAEVADHLAVSVKTIIRWNERGDLPMHRFGRQVRISEDDLIMFAAARRR